MHEEAGVPTQSLFQTQRSNLADESVAREEDRGDSQCLGESVGLGVNEEQKLCCARALQVPVPDPEERHSDPGGSEQEHSPFELQYTSNLLNYTPSKSCLLVTGFVF